MTNAGDVVDERDVYSPPGVVRISDLNRGKGNQVCMPPGSGDESACDPGNVAGETCSPDGNSLESNLFQ